MMNIRLILLHTNRDEQWNDQSLPNILRLPESFFDHFFLLIIKFDTVNHSSEELRTQR